MLFTFLSLFSKRKHASELQIHLACSFCIEDLILSILATCSQIETQYNQYIERAFWVAHETSEVGLKFEELEVKV